MDKLSDRMKPKFRLNKESWFIWWVDYTVPQPDRGIFEWGGVQCIFFPLLFTEFRIRRAKEYLKRLYLREKRKTIWEKA